MSASSPTPILFPQTALAVETLDALTRDLGGPVVLYQPSRLIIEPALWQRAESGQVELRCPVCGDEEHIALLLQHFRRWADDHAGIDLTALAATAPPVPFFSDASSAAMRDVIRRGLSEPRVESAAGQEAERLMQARLLLHLAQQYDQQQRDIEQEIARCQQHEQRLWRQLRGTAPHPPAAEQNRAGLAAAAARLAAWSRLLLQDVAQGRDECDISQLLTIHAEVFDLLREALPAAWQRECRGDTGGCAAGPDRSHEARLRCVHFPGIAPSRLFSHLLRREPPAGREAPWGGETVVRLWTARDVIEK